ncbi:hypothetical protein ACNKHK_02380 [Shigella flexneri]
MRRDLLRGYEINRTHFQWTIVMNFSFNSGGSKCATERAISVSELSSSGLAHPAWFF